MIKGEELFFKLYLGKPRIYFKHISILLINFFINQILISVFIFMNNNYGGALNPSFFDTRVSHQMRSFATKKAEGSFGDPTNYGLLARVLREPRVLSSFANSFLPELRKEKLKISPQLLTEVLSGSEVTSGSEPYLVYRNAVIVSNFINNRSCQYQEILDELNMMRFIAENEMGKYLMEVGSIPVNITDKMSSEFKQGFIKRQITQPKPQYRKFNRIFGVSIVGGPYVGETLPLSYIKEIQLPIGSAENGFLFRELFMVNAGKVSHTSDAERDWKSFFTDTRYCTESQMIQKIKTPEVLLALEMCKCEAWDKTFLHTYQLIERYYSSHSRLSNNGEKASKLSEQKKALLTVAKRMMQKGESKKRIHEYTGLSQDELDDLFKH